MEQQYYPQQSRNIGPQPNILVFGILSLALCSLFGIPGIIFGAIGRSKGNAYVQQGGQLTGASKVGFILSKVGLILGIVMTVVYVTLFIVLIAVGPEVTNEIRREVAIEILP